MSEGSFTPARWFFFFLAAYTLGADAGAYSVTGTAANLKHGRRLNAESGSVAWTGSAASLNRGRSVSVDAGSFNVTGTVATITAARRLTATTGTINLAGTAASLEHAKRLQVESGALLVSGTAASLEYGRHLDAATGTLALSGTASSLEYGRRLNAESGAFVWTGTAASLLYSGVGKTLAADSGSFTATGTAASLEFGRNLSASAEAFTITGSAASLKSDRKFIAASGTFAFAGTAASLEYGYRFTADAGSIGLSGTAAELLYARRLASLAGAFLVTGTDATLEYSAGWSPIWTLEDKYKTALTASDHAALLGLSKTHTEIISTGEFATLETALMHLWRLDSDYTDARGGITLIPQKGTPTFEPALVNDGVRITPTDEQLLATGIAAGALDGDSSFSVAGWVKQNAANSHWYVLYGISVSPFGNGWLLGNFASSNLSLFRVLDAGGGTCSAAAAKIAETDVWVFQCGVWDDVAEEATYYYGIDGGALNTVAGVNSGWTGPRRKSLDGLRSAYFTVGDVTLDELRIWDVALPPALVAAHYAEGLAA